MILYLLANGFAPAVQLLGSPATTLGRAAGLRGGQAGGQQPSDRRCRAGDKFAIEVQHETLRVSLSIQCHLIHPRTTLIVHSIEVRRQH